MKKYFFIIFLGIISSILFNNFSFASTNNVYFSRISLANNREFIQIKNQGISTHFNNLRITDKNNQELFHLNSGNLGQNSYILIAQNKEADLTYNKAKINKNTILKLFIDNQLINYFCNDEDSICNKYGLIKNAEGDEKENFINKAEGNNSDDESLEFGNILGSEEISYGGYTADSKEENVEESEEHLNPKKEDPIDKEEDKQKINNCNSLRINEIFSDNKNSFIELVNKEDHRISVKLCTLAIKYGNKEQFYRIKNKEIDKYFITNNEDAEIILPLKNKVEIYLLDENDNEIDLAIIHGGVRGKSWVKQNNTWVQTYKITKGEENIFQPCREGYYLNNKSGRCIKKSNIEENKSICKDGLEYSNKEQKCSINKTEPHKIVSHNNISVKQCPKGYYLNQSTNRCRKQSTLTAHKTLTPCQNGYFRDENTNRCRKIAIIHNNENICKDGYEKNPDTGRCRRIVKNVGASDPVKNNDGINKINNQETKVEFTGWWLVAGIMVILISFIALNFKEKIIQIVKKGMKK